MMQHISTWLAATKVFISRHKKVVISVVVLAVAAPLALIVVGDIIISSHGKYVLKQGDARHIRIGIVLGAGVAPSGKPYRELQARLDVAAAALQAGQVDKLILSGDNRFDHYNEPQAMFNYLVQTKHIAPEDLQPDYAGRSTYESCERAAKVFEVKETIIFSAGSHLPRAIFLCRHFGIETYGVSSNVEANNSTRRELLARVKALYNVYVIGEPTVLGPRIHLED